jgi:hypothetical protein
MIRRRRRPREIPFSLDSFLDLVANVVGIIIRLILIAWVGARTYTHLIPLPQEERAPATVASGEPIHDPLEGELARRRRELEAAQERLLQQLRLLPPVQDQQEAAGRGLALLAQQRGELDRERSSLAQAVAEQKQASQGFVPSMAQLRDRGKQLHDEIAALEKLPPLKQVLKYRAPISRPVHEEELHFECKGGRVSYVDFPGFVAEVNKQVQQRKQDIMQQGRIEGVTSPSGSFQAHYLLELNRLDGNRLESLCVIEPLAAVRGESLEASLAPGSEFRHVVEGVDARLTVITFWVYPDSFALYRRLRDSLYERDVEVACWPLRDGAHITFGSRGTKSRGQ